MNVLGNELRKMLSNRFLIGACLAFLLINGLRCWNEVQKEWTLEPLSTRRASAQLYKEYEGALKTDSLQKIIAEYNRLTSVVREGQYSTEPGQPGTYTGYVYNDWQLFESLYNNMDYAYHYERLADGIVEKAKQNIPFFETRGNSYETARNTEIAKSYTARKISAYYHTDGWESYLTYSFSSLSVIFLVVFGTASLFCRDRELGISSLLNSCRFGKHRVFLAKTGLAVLYTAVISFAFFMEDWILYAVQFHFTGYSNPVYSLAFLQNSPYSCSLWQYMLLSWGWKLLGATTVCMLSLLSSSLFDSELPAIACAVFLLIPGILLGTGQNGSYMNLFTLSGTLTELKTVPMFGTAIRLETLLSCGAAVSMAVLLFLCYLLEVHRNFIYRRGKTG